MGETTKIAWTDHTFNPWIGCTKISAGCAHCYAETLAKRTGLAVWGDQGTRRVTSNANWKQPRKWADQAKRDGLRRKVFCASLADVFEDREDLNDARVGLCELIYDTLYSLDWLLLTKRPENFGLMPDELLKRIWLGVTLEDESQHARAWKLLETPAKIRFLSVEPMLGPVDLDKYELLCKEWRRGVTIGRYLDWVIVGGESGPGARPMHPDWARSIRDQCAEARVPFFFKQWGGKRAGGDALLDGREWREFPVTEA